MTPAAINRQSSNTEVAAHIGGNWLGPLVSGFVGWLSEQTSRNEDDLLLFFARDGALLYDACIRRKDLVPTTCRYFYVSRQVLHNAAIYDYSPGEIDFAFVEDPVVTLRIIARRLRLDSRLLDRLSSLSGVSIPDQVIHKDEIPRIKQMILEDDRCREHVLESARALRKSLIAYLHQSGATPQVRRIGIVDLGWFGNIQESFRKVVHRELGDIQLNGYYMGLFADRSTAGSSYHSYLFTSASDPQILRRWSMCTGILETVFTAPYGSTVGYLDDGRGTISPELKAQSNALYDAIQGDTIRQHLLDYIERDRTLPAKAGAQNREEFEKFLQMQILRPPWRIAHFFSSGSFSSDQMEISSSPLCRRLSCREMLVFIFSRPRQRDAMSVWRGGCLSLSYPWTILFILMRKVQGMDPWT